MAIEFSGKAWVNDSALGQLFGIAFRTKQPFPIRSLILSLSRRRWLSNPLNATPPRQTRPVRSHDAYTLHPDSYLHGLFQTRCIRRDKLSDENFQFLELRNIVLRSGSDARGKMTAQTLKMPPLT